MKENSTEEKMTNSQIFILEYDKFAEFMHKYSTPLQVKNFLNMYYN
jgi:hypothetical protein